jgi:hypothetical protein
MKGKINKRRAKNDADKLEIDRATVARRLSGVAVDRTSIALPSRELKSPFEAHPAPELPTTLEPQGAKRL